jgi:acyl-CoA synthetase (AMP-forming)/AMP-acid ligase II
LDAIGAIIPPNRSALIHGTDVTTWGDFTRRTNNLASNLLQGGAVTGDKMAVYMRNRREYPESLAASFKARLSHVNVNYRYVAKELIYLLDNADATVCIHAAEFAGQVNDIKSSLPKVTQWIEVADGFTGMMAAINAMMAGDTCVTLPGKSFEAVMALEAISKHKATTVTLVGDAFARPLVEAMDANPGKYDISSVLAMTSSGVMWTRDIKAGLLRHNENMMLADAFSSSEAIGLGSSVMTKNETVDVAKFVLGPFCRVFTEAGEEVLAGSMESGMVAVCGFLPDGYYKDQEKTDKTFKVINGVRYSIPGDWVKVESDGSLTLLGRGSNCINTAGEKVYPEEVEEALKNHESVADCLVIGMPDEKWGQSITAVVEMNRGYVLEEVELRDFARRELAAYKVPKRILSRPSLDRAPNGKANYQLIKEFAEEVLG